MAKITLNAKITIEGNGIESKQDAVDVLMAVLDGREANNTPGVKITIKPGGHVKDPRSITERLLDNFSSTVKGMLDYIEKNVPKEGIPIEDNGYAEDVVRIGFFDHFNGEPGYLTVKKLFPGRVEGTDDYGNEITRCSLEADVFKEDLREIVTYLVNR